MKGFAEIAAPLHELVGTTGRKQTKKYKHQDKHRQLPYWEEKHQQAFESLKGKLTSTPILAYADFSKPFILETDASNQGLGAVLSQD